ncbi:MAG: molybdenum cofactor guanylyltransferase [Candidatus Latescibacteria bacterium]|nr:molybdenum cofactor guanylyltransferase [Candidatus Latescibacterota bacterium]
MSGMTGVVLAGGKSRRIGTDKALLPFGGSTLLGRAVEALQSVVEKVWVIADSTEGCCLPGVAVKKDVRPNCGCLGGIYTGLLAAETVYSLILACDMPFVRPEFLSFLAAHAEGRDVVIPKTAKGYEPLCAVYSKACLKPILSRLEAGRFKVTDLLGQVRVRVVGEAEIGTIDLDGRMFTNINTWAEYEEAVKCK